MRRASSNVTINSTASQSQIFTDGDMIHVANDATKSKPQKRAKNLFGGNNRGILVTKNPPANAKSSNTSSSPSTPTSTKSSTPIANTSHNNSASSLINTNESKSMTINGRSKTRTPTDQTLHVNTRTPVINVKPDRRKDIKLTNCQEKDGIWTATGQFARDSRHSKRAEITYDKKKFRFIQKDDQGSKHVFEIPITDIEGKYFLISSPNYFRGNYLLKDIFVSL
jgi:hypothetical protein